MSTPHPDLQLDEARDFVWTLDFAGVNVAANTYACEVRNLPASRGGTVQATFSVSMAAAATGFVVLTLAAGSVTLALDGCVFDLKETTPGPLTDTVCNGTVRVRPKVTA